MYYIILFIICFAWTSSAFPDFDFPFPIKNTKKHSIETILSESRKQEVGSSENLKNNENPKSFLGTQVESAKTESKIESFKFKSPKKNKIFKIEVVKAQNEENFLKNSDLETVSNVKVPEFSRGIYISQKTLKKERKFDDLRKKGKQHGINFLVIDIQPSVPSKEIVETLITEGFYPVARIVNFDGGLPTEKPSIQRINSIHKSIQAACKSGFPEIQLDYIRYADNLNLKLTYEMRYKNIAEIIKGIRKETLRCNNLPYIGADIFGRIPFNKNDMIGQKVEIFAQLVDVLYPMLYPSHFYGMYDKIKNPYQTVYDGTLFTIKRSLKTTRVIPYIQGFNMSVGKSGLTLSNYIKAQIKASYDSGGHGFVVWNAWNDYEPTFQALKDYEKELKKD